jgi:hypothetical protein
MMMNVYQQEVDSFEEMETDGKITLRPIIDDKYKSPVFMLRCIKNPKTDKWIGIQTGVNSDGTVKFQKITVQGSRVFNLSHPQDAKEWHVIKHAEFIKDGVFQGSRPVFEVFDERVNARKTIDKASRAKSAISYIEKMSWEKLKGFSRLFAINPDFSEEDVVRGQMLEIAMASPIKILEKSEMGERLEILIQIEKGIVYKQIAYEIGKGYMLNDGVYCGATKEGIINFFMKDTQALARMNELCNSEEENQNAQARKKNSVKSQKPTKVQKVKEEEEEEEEEENFVK